MEKRVKTYIQTYNLLRPHARVVVGVSGGADSVALLSVLLHLGYDCIVAHCNFQLRGQDADLDEAFVQQLAAQNNCPYYVEHFDTHAYALKHRLSIEMAARELRYAFFESLRWQYNAEAIAVAHHQNDQAETLLLHLTRSAGLTGCCGMWPKTGNIIRPLLCVTRTDILNYLTLQNLPHREDLTNADPIFKRNAIRAHLAQAPEAIVTHLAQTCTYMQGYARLLESWMNTYREQIVSPTDVPGAIKLYIPTLLSTPDPRTVLFELLRPYNFPQIDDIFRSLTRKSGHYFLTAKYRALKDREFLFVEPRSYRPSVKRLIYWVEGEDSPVEGDPGAFHVVVDGSVLENELTVRKWEHGDAFYPLGMQQSKKVSRFLTDAHVPLFAKTEVQVVLSGDQIVWVVGYQIDNRFRLTPHTQKKVHLSLL